MNRERSTVRGRNRISNNTAFEHNVTLSGVPSEIEFRGKGSLDNNSDGAAPFPISTSRRRFATLTQRKGSNRGQRELVKIRRDTCGKPYPPLMPNSTVMSSSSPLLVDKTVDVMCGCHLRHFPCSSSFYLQRTRRIVVKTQLNGYPITR